ncbi:MAG: hypothetical protein SOZ80_05320 [Prevotella sp.]|uniref:hypothetical protein n=1 Tax=Prevotella sp. TaxID=59823 RepID=UPI002A329BC0|nr:hypothetical protein [Prevotella sp.]MDD7318469.1 hypothetical protein [Prevotellaceae bacterium]MDY4020180.1 hypothetical protein [Prevotella sp.]
MEMKRIEKKIVFVVMLLLAGSYCVAGNGGNRRQRDGVWYEDTVRLHALYKQAVEDAAQPTQNKLVNTLVSIDKTDSGNGQEWIRIGNTDMVLVASFMKEKYAVLYQNSTDTFRLAANESWFTIPAEWKKKAGCFAEMDSVESRMRIIQMLGLPMESQNTHVVLMYIDANTLFRPSRDPETNDRVAQLTYPEGVSEGHRDWFEYNLSLAYQPENPYPWTQIGYTYDWHSPTGTHVGLSEFVSLRGSLVKVKAVMGSHTFIRSLSK